MWTVEAIGAENEVVAVHHPATESLALGLMGLLREQGVAACAYPEEN